MTSIIKKHILKTVLVYTMLLFCYTGLAQSGEQTQYIELNVNKTSSVVFPSAITSVDRGSRDILVQKAKGVVNILQLKAARSNFRETNLTVITADGKLHHFIVRYNEHPAVYTLDSYVSAGDNAETTAILIGNVADAAFRQHTDYILASSSTSRVSRVCRNKMTLTLKGIYIRENVLLYHLQISNASNIPYHADIVRFFVKDKQQAKRTASQELPETPLYIAGGSELIPAKSSVDVVYAFPKFTIPDAKVLIVEMLEKRGGRHLHLNIKNRSIMKAVPIP
jgi:conjugative transposon TraN protein